MGEPGMSPQTQIEDSLERGWIVLTPDHRLCPQVNIQEGPVGDIRSFHTWLHTGGFDAELAARSIPFVVDKSKIIATGTASGGHAALCLAFDNEPTPPPAAIIDFYAPKNFAHPWWTGKRDHLDVNVPMFTPEMEKMVFSEHPVPTRVGLPSKPDNTGKIRLPEFDLEKPTYLSARIAYATNIIYHHKLLDVCWPPPPAGVSLSEHFRPIDPVLNVHRQWPPTAFVHGLNDNLLPHDVTTQVLDQKLQQQGVKTLFVGIENAKHMFAIQMTKDSTDWAETKKAMDWVDKIINEQTVED